jgi:hypothetical protein
MSPTKIIAIVLTVGALSGGAYFALGNSAKGQSDEPLLKSEVTNNALTTIPQGASATDQTVQAVLRQINDLDQIKLNTDIFEKPEFLALKDISQELPEPADIGRPNPFAPIGTDIGTISQEGEVPVTQTDSGLPIVATTVETKEVLNIGRTSATASATTTIAASTSRWFEWGTNENTINKTTKQTGTDAAISATLTGLTPKTTYYVKAAVELNGVVTYGSLVSFKTAE